MTASVLTRQLADAAAGVVVPDRIARRAAAGGWATCDVCSWPVDPAAAVAGRRPRHPGCVCPVCQAPLATLVPVVLYHPQCTPTVGLARSTRRRLTLVGGAR